MLLAPLSQLAITVPTALIYGYLENLSADKVLFGWLVLSAISTALAYLSTIIIGVPVHIWLKRSNRSTVANHSIAGALLGFAVAMVLVSPNTTVDYTGLSLLVFLTSVVVATTFGLISNAKGQRD